MAHATVVILEMRWIMLNFNKSQGLGNDFIIIDNRDGYFSDLGVLAQKLCPRAISVGADTLLVIENSETCALKMRTINADGSEAQMCGNGIRCFAKYAYERGLVSTDKFSIETKAGIITPKLNISNGLIESVTIDMGAPLFGRSAVPMKGDGRFIDGELVADGKSYVASSIFMSIPHTIVFADDPYAIDIASVGPAIERHELYPEGTNVNFVKIIDRNTMQSRPWERGCGATLACGTGACAAAVVGFVTGRTERNVEVKMALGSLFIDYRTDGRVYMTGPAVSVYDGKIDI